MILDLPLEYYSLEQEIERLLEESKQLDHKMQSATGLIDFINTDLSEKFSDKVNSLKDLESKLHVMKAQLSALNIHDEFYPEEPTYIFESVIGESVPESSVVSKKQCKHLYFKIASKCHPDKTGNETLHILFIEAKEAKEALDFQKLEKIWNAVKRIALGKETYVAPFESVGDRIAKLKKERDSLLTNVSETRIELEELLATEGSTISRLYIRAVSNQEKERIFSFFLDQLQNRETQVLSEIRSTELQIDFYNNTPILKKVFAGD